jgi:FkbM family methyltransferase
LKGAAVPALERIGNLYAYIFGWPCLARLHRGLFYMSSRGLGLLNFSSERISGERRAIVVALAGKTKPVVFDVGANEGHWISSVLAICPAAEIHAFEPQPALAERVRATYPHVHLNAIGLGHEPGTLELFDYADHPGSQHASVLPGVIDNVHGGSARSQKVPIGTVDQYCAERRIEHIDFLKIDVEGFELNVLRGAPRMLKGGRIDVIQFEFNEMNLVGRTFMRDFFAELSAAYVLYRLLPHGLIALKSSSIWLNEQFVFQNILAVRRNRS